VASSGRNAGVASAPRGGIRGALGFLYRGESREFARAHGEGGRKRERRGEETGGAGVAVL